MWDATKCERVPSPMRCGTRSHGRARLSRAQDLVDAVGRHLAGRHAQVELGTLRFSSSCMGSGRRPSSVRRGASGEVEASVLRWNIPPGLWFPVHELNTIDRRCGWRLSESCIAIRPD